MDAEELILRSQAQLTTEIDGINVPVEALYPLIPRAIQGAIDSLIENKKEDKLFEFFAEHTVAVTSGVANLSTYSDLGLRLDLLGLASIRITYAGNPEFKKVQIVKSLDRLTNPGIQDFLFVNAYLDGKKLLFADGTSFAADPTTSLTASVVINGVTQPTVVTNLSVVLMPAIQQAIVDVYKKDHLPRRAPGLQIGARKV